VNGQMRLSNEMHDPVMLSAELHNTIASWTTITFFYSYSFGSNSSCKFVHKARFKYTFYRWMVTWIYFP